MGSTWKSVTTLHVYATDVHACRVVYLYILTRVITLLQASIFALHLCFLQVHSYTWNEVLHKVIPCSFCTLHVRHASSWVLYECTVYIVVTVEIISFFSLPCSHTQCTQVMQYWFGDVEMYSMHPSTQRIALRQLDTLLLLFDWIGKDYKCCYLYMYIIFW